MDELGEDHFVDPGYLARGGDEQVDASTVECGIVQTCALRHPRADEPRPACPPMPQVSHGHIANVKQWDRDGSPCRTRAQMPRVRRNDHEVRSRVLHPPRRLGNRRAKSGLVPCAHVANEGREVQGVHHRP